MTYATLREYFLQYRRREITRKHLVMAIRVYQIENKEEVEV